jgi:hypothetical protein
VPWDTRRHRGAEPTLLAGSASRRLFTFLADVLDAILPVVLSRCLLDSLEHGLSRRKEESRYCDSDGKSQGVMSGQ